RARGIPRALRVLAALVAALVLSQSTLAFAFPCFGAAFAGEVERGCCEGEDGRDDGHERGSEDEGGDGEGDEHERCPCPIDCGRACGGGALRAVPPACVVAVMPSPLLSEVIWGGAERSPPPIEPTEIGHVPRAFAA
ncbi:MAG TPA: hypothetical protein VLS89_06995, partial [Candidatus Nanopelagicales bacterium]|nr:hypothetical protein [Candidatus Nanopelagicales bacterium]